MCPEHAQQLNYRKNQEVLRAQEKAAKKHKRRSGSADGSRHASEAAPAEPIIGHKRRRESDEPEPAGNGADTEGVQGEEEGDAAGGSSEDVNVWKGKQPQLETSRDEEFDEYFNGMFL